MATPIPTEISILEVGTLDHSPNGHPFVECKARGGTVAFWGSPGNMKNINEVRKAVAPFTIICDSIRSNWPNHDLWVPEGGEIYCLEPVDARKPSSRSSAETSTNPVTLQELARWRHSVIEILNRLEAAQSAAGAADGVALRIGRLSHQGAIPREIGALMRSITEMRNAAEYESKVLSQYESLAIRNAWMAVEQWWKHAQAAKQ